MAKQNGTSVITNEVRLSYVYLTKPKESDNGGKPKYSICVMVPKKDKETLNALIAAYNQAYNESITKVWGGKKAEKKSPFRDGDTDPTKEGKSEFKGMYFFNASSVRKPQVIDKATGELAAEDEIYSDFSKIYRKYTIRNKDLGDFFIRETKDNLNQLCDDFEHSLAIDLPYSKIIKLGIASEAVDED